MFSEQEIFTCVNLMGGAILVEPVLQEWVRAGAFLWCCTAVPAEKEGLSSRRPELSGAHWSQLGFIRDQKQTKKTAERGTWKQNESLKVLWIFDLELACAGKGLSQCDYDSFCTLLHGMQSCCVLWNQLLSAVIWNNLYWS